VVKRAVALGFAAIALTDHDTVAGIEEAADTAAKVGIEFLAGTEISSHYGKAEIHIVGLGVNPGCTEMIEALRKLREAREARAEAMVEKLNGLGLVVDLDRVRARAGGAVGRLHLAQELHDLGYTKTVQDGFDRYIGRGRRAYQAKKTLSCRRAIELIHAAGGLAVIGHPGVGTSCMPILSRLLAMPFDGIEVYHTKHTPGHVTQFELVAREHNLLISGGSDCHGRAKDLEPEMGKVKVPYQYYERIRNALETRI